jgi:hypothetical protein
VEDEVALRDLNEGSEEPRLVSQDDLDRNRIELPIGLVLLN